jgi:PilZ domain-containing protein
MSRRAGRGPRNCAQVPTRNAPGRARRPRRSEFRAADHNSGIAPGLSARRAGGFLIATTGTIVAAAASGSNPMADVSIVIADAATLPAIRDGLQLPGRMMHFTGSSLAGAIESIRAYRPKIVAVDAQFAQTSSGAAFVDRVNVMALAGSSVRLIVQRDGAWTTVSQKEAKASPIVVTAPAAPTVASLSSVLAAASAAPSANTRRVPRFLVRDPIEASVDTGRAGIIDMSVLGAQMVSMPPLRPNQKIKVALPDTDDVLNLVAQVAWSMFEQTPSTLEPRYRVGIEFTDAAKQTLEAYRRRYCTEQPIPHRSR